MEEKNARLTEEEIEDKINSIKGIWAIEGMGMTAEEEESHRSFLRGAITKQEYEGQFLTTTPGKKD